MAPLLGSEEAGLGSVLTAAGGSQSGGPSTGDPVSIATFTGMIVGAEGTISAFLANPGTQQAFAEGVIELDPQLYPTSARTFEKLTATATNGNGGTLYTVTLYRNGAATAQTVTVLAGAAAGTVFTDSAHPISFADGDKFDVVVSKAGSADSAAFMAVTLEGPDGSGGGSGDFPGYGPAPPGILAASAAGVSALVSRSDHTHGGVTSVTAGVSNLISVTPNAGAVIVDTAQLFVNGINTGAAQLGTLPSANYNTGQLCWVNSVGAYFHLQVSPLATDGITSVAASGSPTRRWLRINQLNRVWAAQGSWTVNTTTGSDENAGAVGSPLATLSEVARRLAFAMINSAIAVTVIGSQVASDMACFSCIVNTAAGGFVSISYTPTTIYAGVVTTYTAPTPAPSTDDPQLHDTGITGGSFTAAGLLATGVIGTTTTGTALAFFFAKDLGGTTARTSMPYAGAGDGALAAGQGYVGQQLPTGRQIRFSDQTPGAFFVSNALFPSGTTWFDQSVFFQQCWFVNYQGGPRVFVNCVCSGSTQWSGTASGNFPFVWDSGMMRGTGATSFLLFNCTTAQTNFTVTIQGGSFVSQTSMCTIQGDLRVYDFSGGGGKGCVAATYWGFILWSVGAFAGSNNTNLAYADRMSQIGHVSNPNWVAGSSTSGTPIAISGTGNISVASESAGGGVVNAQQNGVYPTS